MEVPYIITQYRIYLALAPFTIVILVILGVLAYRRKNSVPPGRIFFLF